MGLLVVVIVLVVVVGLSVAIWSSVPRFAPKETQFLWKNSLVLSLACMYLMWALTYLAQLHPLIAPTRADLEAKGLE